MIFRLIVALLVVVTSVRADEEKVTAATEPITIGAILPLTGSWSSWGEKIRQGLELSRESMHLPVKFLYQDEATCEPAKGVAGARALFAQNIKIIIVGCVSTTRALLADAKREDAILFSAGLLDRASFEGGARVVSWATQVGTEAVYQSDYIAKNHYRSVAVVRANEPFGEELATVLKLELKKRNVEVSFDDRDAYSTNDFGPVALNIIRKKPELVVINLGESQQRSFIRKIRDMHITTPILSTYGLESNTSSTDNVKDIEGITYTYPVNTEENSPEKRNFDRDFAAKFGAQELPNANSYFVHDGLKLLEKSLAKCSPLQSDCIFKFFTTQGTQSGIAGQVTYGPEGSADRPYAIKRVVDGKFIWIK